jgi:small subunit ribosomal protein S17
MDERGNRKKLIGVVTSDAMEKTIVVRVDRLVRHEAYKKFISQAKKLKAHDEKNECQVGDRVQIQESRPLSRTKRWRVVKIVERAAR